MCTDLIGCITNTVFLQKKLYFVFYIMAALRRCSFLDIQLPVCAHFPKQGLVLLPTESTG